MLNIKLLMVINVSLSEEYIGPVLSDVMLKKILKILMLTTAGLYRQ